MLDDSIRLHGGQPEGNIKEDHSIIHPQGANFSPRKDSNEEPRRPKQVPWRICINGLERKGLILILSSLCLLIPTEALAKDELDVLQRERAEAALKWAPMIWLHPEERFFPTSVHRFLKYVVPTNIPESHRLPDPPVLVSMSRSLNTLVSLPEGTASKDTYLIAPIDPACRNCPLPRFLHGTKPTRNYMPAVYAVITSCLPTKNPIRARSLPRRRFMIPLPRSLRRFKYKKETVYARSSRHVDAPHFYENEACDSHESKVDEKKEKRRKKPLGELKPFSDIELNTLGTASSFYEDDIPHEENNLIPLPISTLLPPEPPKKEAIVNASNVEKPLFNIETTTYTDSTTEFHSFETPASEDEELIHSTTSSYSLIHELTPVLSHHGEDTLSDKTRITRDPEVISSTIKNHYSTKNLEKNLARLKGHKFTVTYWMFYPFSQGKRVCTRRLWLLGRIFKPRIRSKCYGELVTLNSHVGDWEHISIFFEDGIPQRLYVSTHTYGAYYHYHRGKNVFLYRGKDTRLGLPLNPKYPPVVKMEGTHPVIYAAVGSHGLWGAPGVHRYEKFVPLEDTTAAGTRWNTWENVDIIDYRSPDLERPDRQWLNFNGKWGNPSYGCHRALFGSCDLANGPTGIPLKRANFPCYLPQHPTFHPKL